MSDHGPSIDGELIRVFILVYIHSGYKNVSDILHVDRSTIKKKIARLEEIVGEKLFERHGHSIVLTPRGRTLMLHASKFYAFASDFSKTLAKKGGFFTETLNLAGPAFITEFIASKVLSLQNPYIDAQKVLISRDIHKTAKDYIKFTIASTTSPNKALKHVGRIAFAPAASPLYISRARFPLNIEEAIGHRFIIETESKIDQYVISRTFGKMSDTLATTVYVPDFNSKMSMVRYGAGIGVVPLICCTPESGIVKMQLSNYKYYDLYAQASPDLAQYIDLESLIEKIRHSINSHHRSSSNDMSSF